MTPPHANPFPVRPPIRGWPPARGARACPGHRPGGPRPAAQDEPVTLNFTNADIEAVVKAVAEITGKSFIVDPRVKGTVTIVSARPVPRSLVYPTLLSALRTQGVTAVESDNVVRIVPESEAKLQGGRSGAAR
jgi:general secretion pathway protein D